MTCLKGADLEGASNLTIKQLSKVRILYNAELDDKLLMPLNEKYTALFEEPTESFFAYNITTTFMNA
jgi:hypothetical protein